LGKHREVSECRSSAQRIETSEWAQRHNPLGFDTSLRSYSAGASLLLDPTIIRSSSRSDCEWIPTIARLAKSGGPRVPEIVSGLPANQWRLSDAGRLRCKRLAERLATYDPDVIVASLEPKAIETGQIVADVLSKPFETAENLHEHDRSNVGPLDTKEQFEAGVAGVFENPQKLIFGRETADDAHRRFAEAVAGVIGKYASGNLAVVTHGTVMTLFVARAAGLDSFPFWKRLGLPSFVVLSLPGFGLLTVVGDVK
jgi:broad specificity phosphatase PhoE